MSSSVDFSLEHPPQSMDTEDQALATWHDLSSMND
jgi:hypothetical protein